MSVQKRSGSESPEPNGESADQIPMDRDVEYLKGLTISEQIGRLLHIARVRVDKKAAELSLELGYSKSYLSQIESGTRPLNRRALKKLAERLNFSQNEFDLLWSYSVRGNGQEYNDVVKSESILGNVYKEDFMFSVGKAISHETIDFAALYNGELAEIELPIVNDDVGHLGREFTVTIQVR